MFLLLLNHARLARLTAKDAKKDAMAATILIYYCVIYVISQIILKHDYKTHRQESSSYKK